MKKVDNHQINLTTLSGNLSYTFLQNIRGGGVRWVQGEEGGGKIQGEERGLG